MFRKQAALHNPDMIAGEYAHNIGGLGDKKLIHLLEASGNIELMIWIFKFTNKVKNLMRKN